MLFPVPWAQDASTSFLASPDKMKDASVGGQLRNIVAWNDTSEIGKEWFKAVNKRLTESGPSPLGFQVSARCQFRCDGEEPGPQSGRGPDPADRDHLCETAKPCPPTAARLRASEVIELRCSFAAVGLSLIGSSRHFAAMRNLVLYRGIADLASRSAQQIYGFTA